MTDLIETLATPVHPLHEGAFSIVTYGVTSKHSWQKDNTKAYELLTGVVTEVLPDDTAPNLIGRVTRTLVELSYNPNTSYGTAIAGNEGRGITIHDMEKATAYIEKRKLGAGTKAATLNFMRAQVLPATLID